MAANLGCLGEAFLRVDEQVSCLPWLGFRPQEKQLAPATEICKVELRLSMPGPGKRRSCNDRRCLSGCYGFTCFTRSMPARAVSSLWPEAS
jgi:hypothetical protein